MNVHLQLHAIEGEASGGFKSLGNVRTEQVKRIAKELIKRFPNRFSNNFEENKRVISLFLQGATPRVRNQIAGYITSIYSGMRLSAVKASEKNE